MHVISAIEPVVVEDPCDPNPCGPNSNPPRNLGSTCHCTCLPEMIGSPPNCRPECVVNSECPSDKACMNRKCQDPCPGLCGINAYCSVRNHVPICICNQGYIGDPFSSCYRPTTTSKSNITTTINSNFHYMISISLLELSKSKQNLYLIFCFLKK